MIRISGSRVVGILIILALLAAGAVFYRAARSPESPLLVAKHGARWIRINEPSLLVIRTPGFERAGFRKTFRVDNVPEKALLTVHAFKDASVFLDDVPVLAASSDLDAWVKPRQVDLSLMLDRGTHVLRIIAANYSAPAAVLAYLDEIGLRTGPDWEASSDGLEWSPAIDVETFRPAPLSRMFQRADRAFLSNAPYMLAIFSVVFIWTLCVYLPKKPIDRLVRVTPSASTVRWWVMGLWVVLALNNIVKVPVSIGFDMDAHMDYIDYVASNWRIPFATEGWQMFQSPLYYILSAPLFLVFKKFLTLESTLMALKVIPLACGIFQVELSYRAVKHLWPDREDMRALAVIIGGLLPMNIYMSQYLGNEPLSGVFSAAAVVWAFKIHAEPSGERSLTDLFLLGVFLGLALLSKATAVLLIPPLALILIYRACNTQTPLRRAASSLGIVLGAAFVISGWYYIRNWIVLGKPFMGGWDPSTGMVWWQDPGYRTPAQFLSFGQSLVYPVNSSINGIWDSIYSTLWTDASLGAMANYEKLPPWNYSFMLSGALLALLPTAGIIAGWIGALRSPARGMKSGALFALLFVGIYLAAIFGLYLKLPVYTTAKASYMMGIIPCFALLGAYGFSLVMRSAVIRAFVYGGIACWAAFAYIAYFAV
ncbi:MAG: glycosyltransferase family 39 protein [Deltaproteobacteria bacterium]|nr:glycosyltransferase family 39 protein [Deltaproteobacteria bacterium]